MKNVIITSVIYICFFSNIFAAESGSDKQPLFVGRRHSLGNTGASDVPSRITVSPLPIKGQPFSSRPESDRPGSKPYISPRDGYRVRKLSVDVVKYQATKAPELSNPPVNK